MVSIMHHVDEGDLGGRSDDYILLKGVMAGAEADKCRTVVDDGKKEGTSR